MEDGCTIEVESGSYEWEPSWVPSRSPGLISLSSAPAALITSRNICISPATLLKGQTVVNGHRDALRPSGRVAVHKFDKRELGRKCGSCHRTCEVGCFGSSSDVLDHIPDRNHLRRKGLCCHVVWNSSPSQGGTWQQKLPHSGDLRNPRKGNTSIYQAFLFNLGPQRLGWCLSSSNKSLIFLKDISWSVSLGWSQS